MSMQLSDLTHRLAEQAEAVCRHYLSNGRRVGGYWIVGDARNTPGRSMFVRLNGCNSGKGARGKWTDAATGEHGDLLDVIQESRRLVEFRDVVDEAQRFLLAGSSDQDGWVWLLHNLRRVEWASELVVFAFVRLFITGPHLVRYLQSLLQSLEALCQGREGDA